MKKLILSCSLLFMSLGAFAAKSVDLKVDKEARELVKQFDLASYHPDALGLKDLVVDIRIDNLTKQMNEQAVFGKLQDVYFQLAWMAPDKLHVEVKGMPDGFLEVKNELSNMVARRFDYIVPQLLAPKLSMYSLNLNKQKDGTNLVRAIDRTGKSDVNEITLLFGKNNELLHLETKRPSGSELSVMKHSHPEWSPSKWILSELAVSSLNAGQKIVSVISLSYGKFSGFGLPTELETKTKQGLAAAVAAVDGKNQNQEREFTTKMTFSSYKVNVGEAAKIFKNMPEAKKK